MAESTYRQEAIEEATAAVEENMKEIVDQLWDDGAADVELSYYDREFITTYSDRSYRLLEAAQVLDDLSDYEESDSGLWSGVEDPKEAVGIMAAYTYGNAVAAFFTDDMENVNSDVDDLLTELRAEYDRLESRISTLSRKADRTDEEESELDALTVQNEEYEIFAKKRLKDAVLISIGRKEAPRDPKDWSPE